MTPMEEGLAGKEGSGEEVEDNGFGGGEEGGTKCRVELVVAERVQGAAEDENLAGAVHQRGCGDEVTIDDECVVDGFGAGGGGKWWDGFDADVAAGADGAGEEIIEEVATAAAEVEDGAAVEVGEAGEGFEASALRFGTGPEERAEAATKTAGRLCVGLEISWGTGGAHGGRRILWWTGGTANAVCLRRVDGAHRMRPMQWLLHGKITPAAAEALVRHEQKVHQIAELGVGENAEARELLKAAQTKQWEVLTSEAGLVQEIYDQAIWFNRSVVYLQVEGGEVEQDDAVDRLFGRYKRLSPGRLYTVTQSRVKVRQLPRRIRKD